MSIESGQQLSELRNLAQHNVEQLNRAATGLIEIARNAAEAFVAPNHPASAYVTEFVRRTFDLAETNVAAFCDHAHRLAQASSPAECVKLQTEFVRSSIASMQKQSMGMMSVGGESSGGAAR